jgi:hypothetical protein
VYGKDPLSERAWAAELVMSLEAACKPSSVPGPICIGPATAIHLSDLPEG